MFQAQTQTQTKVLGPGPGRAQANQRTRRTAVFLTATCDVGHLVGEVALLQVLKMSRQPFPSGRQCAVVPRLPLTLAKKRRSGILTITGYKSTWT